MLTSPIDGLHYRVLLPVYVGSYVCTFVHYNEPLFSQDTHTYVHIIYVCAYSTYEDIN